MPGIDLVTEGNPSLRRHRSHRPPAITHGKFCTDKYGWPLISWEDIAMAGEDIAMVTSTSTCFSCEQLQPSSIVAHLGDGHQIRLCRC